MCDAEWSANWMAVVAEGRLVRKGRGCAVPIRAQRPMVGAREMISLGCPARGTRRGGWGLTSEERLRG